VKMSMNTSVQTPRAAATLILLRPGAGGLETLMLQRTQTAVFLGGAYVFPGGSLDPADADTRRVLGLAEAEANQRLGVASGGIAYYVAAVRECFEEAGVLLACDANANPVLPARAEKLMASRARPFLELLEKENLFIPAGALAYYGHWITQPGRSRRFDTRFFVTLAPEGQEGAHDATETVHHVWIRPREALERAARGEIELVHATRQTLTDLGRFTVPRDAYGYAMSLTEIPTNRACWAQGKEGARVFRRGDPQYHEIHWSDPEESGQTSYDLIPGVPKRLDRYTTRLIAPNPGMMTGPGTNTYLIGEDELAVVDPGPAIDSHIEKILSMGKIRWILCTHTHMDHSPAAAAIKKATGATIYGRPAPAGQDASFAPDQVLSHGERVNIGALSLRAIHTPGHASNHLCYLLEQTKMLFTGDHVMQGSTVVINPPDGDMSAYLASLELLLAEDVAILAPGHGYLIGEPRHEVRRLVQHRLKRESKVRDAIVKLGEPTLEEMLPLVYDDVPVRLHGWAARSLTAHLQKLVADGAAQAKDGRYTLLHSQS
jgi:glyoxylase-like metal-dependent hydrolase (beta-lactamase superfamily II)/8-oxo-dGTP pyrophosphatase MutT (NUDIX family)